MKSTPVNSIFARAAMTLLLAVMTSVTTQAENTLNTLESNIDHCVVEYNENGVGYIFIDGWVYDSFAKQWEAGEEIEVSAFLHTSPNDDGWEARSSDVEYVVRDDVNTAHSLNGKHGFRMNIEVPPYLLEGRAEMALYVKIYATVNNGNGNENILLNSPYNEVTLFDISRMTLFSDFSVYSGDGHGGGTYSNLVDGDLLTSWGSKDLINNDNEFYEVRFHVKDNTGAILPKVYFLYADENYCDDLDFQFGASLGIEGIALGNWTSLSACSDKTLPQNGARGYSCNNPNNDFFDHFFFKVRCQKYINSSVINKISFKELKIYGWCYTHVTVKAATCTEIGILQDCYYRNDGKYFADPLGETELNTSEVVEPKLPHTLVHCITPDANLEYWHCTVCDKYFSDAECTEEIFHVTSGTIFDTTTWTSGRYFVSEDVTIPTRVYVRGEVSLTLCDNTTLVANRGIDVLDGSLQIHGYSTDEQTMGTLIATTRLDQLYSNEAAIGCNYDNTIIITGGKVLAQAVNGAAIGSRANSVSGGDIRLNGGVILAESYSGSGIGSGDNSNGNTTVNISDGIKIICASSANAMGIGNGANPKGATVTVNFYHGSTAVTGNDKDAVFYDTGEGASRKIRSRTTNHSINISDDLRAHISTTPLAYTNETVRLTLDLAVDETTLNVSDGTNNLSLTSLGYRQYSFVMPNGDVTVTATFEPHSITIDDDLLAHVTASATSALRGQTITLTLDVAVDETKLNVSDGTNNLTLTDKGNRQYSFVMPYRDVTVTATILDAHSITIGDNILAYVTASAASAYRGETVTLTLDVLIDETTLTVSDGTNNLTLTNKGNRKYSFVMPDDGVTVTAAFNMADLRDGVAYDHTKDVIAPTATYTKSLGEERVGLHQAWLVPFDYTITAADLDMFTFYKINMIANSPSPDVEASNEIWVFLTRLNAGDMLHANMPYVYKPKEAVTDYAFTTAPATLKAKNTGILSDTRTMEDIYSFYATYENTTPAASDPFYYVGIDGNVSLGNNGAVTVGPYRWIIRKTSKYGNTPSYVRQMHFFDDESDDVDGIVEVQGSRFKVQAGGLWYDLQGRKIGDSSSVTRHSSLPKGIYIHNGKKVVIK